MCIRDRKYAANFGRNERNVELDGEAYFEVAKNKNIPFYVHTETNKGGIRPEKSVYTLDKAKMQRKGVQKKWQGRRKVIWNI